MYHRCGVRDEGLYTAQADGQHAYLRAAYRPVSSVKPTFHLKRKHPAEPTVHLPLRKLMLWVRRQAGIVDPLHRRVALQEARYFEAIAIVHLHPETVGL